MAKKPGIIKLLKEHSRKALKKSKIKINPKGLLKAVPEREKRRKAILKKMDE